MENIPNYKLTVGALTALSGLLAAACIFLGANAVDYNFEAFSEPTLILQYAHNHKQAYWFLLLDMVGYYLLLLRLFLPAPTVQIPFSLGATIHLFGCGLYTCRCDRSCGASFRMA
jgi:membrane associated rhomboid family serine protease